MQWSFRKSKVTAHTEGKNRVSGTPWDLETLKGRKKKFLKSGIGQSLLWPPRESKNFPECPASWIWRDQKRRANSQGKRDS